MKDHVEIGHLTKYDAFRVNSDQAMNMKYGLKSIQVSLILTQHPPKSYKQFDFRATLLNGQT